MCENPYRKGVLELGCGRCMSCRTNRSRLWVARMMLESYEHDFSAFVTLTYDEENVPWENGRQVLRPRDAQLFLKSLRERISPRVLRYYLVGEYGDESWRPHYHLVLFGVSPMEGALVQEVWKLGYTFTGTAEAKSMSYVAQYVVKKMTGPKDARLNGRPPEFCRMSQGLGKGVVPRMVKVLEHMPVEVQVQASQVRLMGKKWPIGRYLKEKVLNELGVRPEQRKAGIRAIVEQKYAEVMLTGPTYDQKRKARVMASQGKKLQKGGTL